MKINSYTKMLNIALYALVPILGLLFFDWDWREIVFLYWLGIMSIVISMTIYAVILPFYTNNTSRANGLIGSFFCLLVILFLGIFVLMLISGGATDARTDPNLKVPPEDFNLLGVLSAWFVGVILQTILQFIATTPTKQAYFAKTKSFFKRAVLFYLGLCVTGFIIASFNQPLLAAISMIVLHVIADLDKK